MDALDVQSLTEVDAPVFGAGYTLTDDDDLILTDDGDLPLLGTGNDFIIAGNIQSTTEVSAPSMDAGWPLTDDLDAVLTDDLDFPLFGSYDGLTNALLASSIESATEVSAPAVSNVAAVYALTATLDVLADPDEIDFALSPSDSGTLYWRLDVSGGLSAAAIEAGGGEASGSISITSGVGTGTLDFTTEPGGSYFLNAVFKNGTSYSNVSATAITVPNLVSTDVESVTELSRPTLSQAGISNLLATSVESATELTTPSLSRLGSVLRRPKKWKVNVFRWRQ